MKTKYLFPAIIVLFTLCYSCEKQSSGGDDPVIDVNVPDPQGTVELKMRNASNGYTWIESAVYITGANNLRCDGGIIGLGSVRGLGNIVSIPINGWANEVAVQPGNGYIAYKDNKYYRIRVEDWILAAGTDGIIGAEVKYQTPFTGKDEDIALSKTEFSFPKNGGEEKVVLSNTTLFPFDIVRQEGASDYWLEVTRTGKNEIKLRCTNNTSPDGRETQFAL